MSSKILNDFSGPMESSCLHGHSKTLSGKWDECGLPNNETLKITPYEGKPKICIENR